MAKRRKRTEKAILKDKADRLWSCAVVADWGHRCAMTGQTGGKLDPHHLIPREYSLTRFDLRNGLCLNSYYHVRCPKRAPHKNPAGFLEWLEEEYPDIASWYYATNDSVCHNPQPGIKTVEFYTDTIRELRQYVPDDDYRRIVGVRVADWLDCE